VLLRILVRGEFAIWIWREFFLGMRLRRRTEGGELLKRQQELDLDWVVGYVRDASQMTFLTSLPYLFGKVH